MGIVGRMIAYGSVVVALGIYVLPSHVHAYCGTINGDQYDDLIIVGMYMVYVDGFGYLPGAPDQRVGACVDGQLTILPGCDSSTASSDSININAGAGDDVVSVHPGSPFSCGSSFVGAFDPDIYDFGVEVYGEDGADIIYGSPNVDYLMSNEWWTTTWDGDIDILCGYGGNDGLYGNANDSASDYECMDGGDQSDTCSGRGGATEYDEWTDCETVESAEEAGVYWCYNPPYNICISDCVDACPASPPDLIL